MIGENNYHQRPVEKKLLRERVLSKDLAIGMYVVELDRPWIETPFLFQGFLISSAEEIKQLQEHCEYVFIDVTQTTVSVKKQDQAKTEVTTKRIYKVPVEKELAVAATHYDFAKGAIDNSLQALRLSQEIDTDQIKIAVQSCVDSVINNPNALMWLTQIKNKDDYTAEHSLRVSILTVALGQELGLMEKELVDIGMAGMLHDVGKIKIPLEVLNKEGSLNDDEYELIKTHADHGRQLLMSNSRVPHSCIDVAYSHHEHINGRGYPRGISSEKIPFYAKIVGVVDAFDAITSDRVYSKARTTLEALRILYDCRGSQFDEEVVRAFIRLMGIYPPGHIAELSNGEVGIILSCHRNNKLKPKVIIVRNAEKKLCTERVIDLSKDPKDKNGFPLRVKAIFTDGEFGIHLQEYKNKGLRFDTTIS